MSASDNVHIYLVSCNWCKTTDHICGSKIHLHTLLLVQELCLHAFVFTGLPYLTKPNARNMGHDPDVIIQAMK